MTKDFLFIMESSNSDDMDSDEHFTFNINKEMLLKENDVVLIEMIGEGASSIVYKGLLKKQFFVAIKIFQPSRTCAVSVETKRKFQREVLMLSKIKHDNIIQFIGACIEPHLMIVTELMEGGNLQKLMWNVRPCLLDLRQSLSFALDIARAMDSLHSNGIIHRDIKPNNIMVRSDHKQVKLVDFGLAREETTNCMTYGVGSLKWMAPELINQDEQKHYDHKVDVYSFGILLWELVTNQTPFKGKDIISIAYGVVKNNLRPSVENLPEDIVFLLQSCWAKDSNARPEFKEIIVLLRNLIMSLCSSNTIMKLEEEVNEEKTKQKKKKKKMKLKLRNMILHSLKVFTACWSKS